MSFYHASCTVVKRCLHLPSLHISSVIQSILLKTASPSAHSLPVLAHASGEWIASDWPVCRLADTAAPHRMGAALTYARRYALFTLVGIAGEDDLDAPGLNDRPPQLGGPGNLQAIPLPVASQRSRRPSDNGHDRARPILDPDNSAVLRDKLVREITSIGSSEDAAEWARTALAAKNTLTASDARLVDVAFELRLSSFEAEGDPQRGVEAPGTAEQSDLASEQGDSQTATLTPRKRKAPDFPEPLDKPAGIDKSVLKIAEPKRYRDKAHLKFVASQPCLFCGRRPCDPHHLRFAQARALGRKVSDEFTVPLCRTHHRELHRTGNEAGWWAKVGIDAVRTAQTLWKTTRTNGVPASSAVAEAHAAAPTVAAPRKPRARRRAEKRSGPQPVETVPPRA